MKSTPVITNTSVYPRNESHLLAEARIGLKPRNVDSRGETTLFSVNSSNDSVLYYVISHSVRVTPQFLLLFGSGFDSGFPIGLFLVIIYKAFTGWFLFRHQIRRIVIYITKEAFWFD